MKTTYSLLLCTSVLLFSPLVMAGQCRVASSGSEVDNLNVGSLLLQRDQPVGSVLLRRVVSGTGQEVASCGSQRHLHQVRMVNTSRVPGFRHVYESGVPGVGIRVEYEGNAIDATGNYEVEKGSSNLKSQQSYVVSFIRTGPVSPGEFAVRDILEERIADNARGWVVPRKLRITGGGVKQASCQVRTPALIVPMGDVEVNTLARAGQAGALHDFSVGLSCDAGTPLSITFNRLVPEKGGATRQADGVIGSLQETGGAQGIGVQIIHDKKAVSLDTPLSLGTTQYEGNLDIPFQARYFQTMDKVMPGRVNAVAGFTLTYQ